MNLCRVTFDGRVYHMVVAASGKQAAVLIADALNCRVTCNGITYQITDFDVNKIDIDSFRETTIID